MVIVKGLNNKKNKKNPSNIKRISKRIRYIVHSYLAKKQKLTQGQIHYSLAHNYFILPEIIEHYKS